METRLDSVETKLDRIQSNLPEVKNASDLCSMHCLKA